jgi:NAD(P)-dependent dehydrogenase (short-subunit alcohol dehydrogenase family)
VNISSLAAVIGLPFSGLYSASKFALEGMTESLRWEVRPFGIRVALVEPGDFRTELPAKRKIVRGAQSGDTYREALARFQTQQDKDESTASTPEPVALLVESILRDPNPRLRYSVGKIDQRIVIPAKRILPQRAFEWLLGRVLGLSES